MEYDKDCIFCKIARKEIPSDFVYENDNFFAIKDINPKVMGHKLIISKKHFVNIMDIPSTMGEELIDIIKNVADKELKQGFDGFNIAQNNFPASGQVVMHFHLHLLPRKKSDGFSWNL